VASNPRTKSIFVYALSPNQTANDGIKVVNNSDETKTLTVYAVDSQPSSDGAFACAQQADAQKEVGKWLSLSKTRVTLEPKTNETVNFSVTVPAHADVGEHNGCIAIQDVSAGTQQSQNGIALSFRSALRVAVTVPGTLVTKLQFVDVKTKSLSQEKLQVTPTVRNLGNVSLDTDLQVKLVNMFNAPVVSNGGKFPVLRQTTGKFNFELETPFWGGWYKRVTEARYAPLAQSDTKPTPETLKTQSAWVFIMPQPLAALIELGVIVLAAAAIVATIWRRYRHNQMHVRAMRHTVSSDDDLQTIAQTYHVRWQKIAQLNKLKPPYALKPGTVIRVPRASKKTDAANPQTHPKG
jgi:hypothetical protein